MKNFLIILLLIHTALQASDLPKAFGFSDSATSVSSESSDRSDFGSSIYNGTCDEVLAKLSNQEQKYTSDVHQTIQSVIEALQQKKLQAEQSLQSYTNRLQEENAPISVGYACQLLRNFERNQPCIDVTVEVMKNKLRRSLAAYKVTSDQIDNSQLWNNHYFYLPTTEEQYYAWAEIERICSIQKYNSITQLQSSIDEQYASIQSFDKAMQDKLQEQEYKKSFLSDLRKIIQDVQAMRIPTAEISLVDQAFSPKDQAAVFQSLNSQRAILKIQSLVRMKIVQRSPEVVTWNISREIIKELCDQAMLLSQENALQKEEAEKRRKIALFHAQQQLADMRKEIAPMIQSSFDKAISNVGRIVDEKKQQVTTNVPAKRTGRSKAQTLTQEDSILFDQDFVLSVQSSFNNNEENFKKLDNPIPFMCRIIDFHCKQVYPLAEKSFVQKYLQSIFDDAITTELGLSKDVKKFMKKSKMTDQQIANLEQLHDLSIRFLNANVVLQITR